jgi:hypothetical protein
VTRFVAAGLEFGHGASYSSDMFVKITTSGPRQYVKLVEAFRDASGMPRQRVIATLGRLESIQAGHPSSTLLPRIS